MERIFRVTRFPKSSSLADEIALLCTKSNGRDTKISISFIEGYVACAIILYPHSNSGIVVSRISDYHLIIDQDSQPLIEILETEIFENPIMDIYDQSSN
jgi:hypothetical protein